MFFSAFDLSGRGWWSATHIIIWGHGLVVSHAYHLAEVKGCGQLLTLSSCGPGLVVSSRAHHFAEVRGCLVITHAHHLAEVKGWWSAILTVSSCGARQPCASSHHLVEARRCMVISHAHHLAEVRGWWSATHVLLWSRVGGQLLSSCIILPRSGTGGQPCA